MPIELSPFLSVLNVVLMIGLTIGGVIVFRGSRGKAIAEVQDRTIEALKTQTETQERQIKALEKKITHLNRVMITVEYALKRRGLRIEIDDDAITLIDERSRANQTVQIRMMDAVPEEDEEA